MPSVDVGLFRLVDAPAGQEQLVRDALAAIDGPWDLLAPYAASDPDGAYLVLWVDLPQGTTGVYEKYGREIHLDADQAASNPSYTRFVIAHEIGHLVDWGLLRNPARKVLLDMMIAGSVPVGHLTHDHPDARHEEIWRDNKGLTPYMASVHEAWADVFVYTYAPTLWNAPRFVHHTTDRAGVRYVVEQGVAVQEEQVAGANRYESAVVQSILDWDSGMLPWVHIVAGADPAPDGLPASRSKKPGPVLYASARPDDPLLRYTLEEVHRLQPVGIRWHGGFVVIPEDVRQAIRAAV